MPDATISMVYAHVASATRARLARIAVGEFAQCDDALGLGPGGPLALYETRDRKPAASAEMAGLLTAGPAKYKCNRTPTLRADPLSRRMRERRLLKPVEGAGLTFQAPLSFGLGVGVDLDEPGVCRRVMSHEPNIFIFLPFIIP